MNRLIPLAAGALLFLGALLAPLAGQDNKAGEDIVVTPYFPLKVGTTWEYLSGGKTIVVKVASHDKLDDLICAGLETDAAGRVVTEHLTVKEDGVYRVRSNDKDIKPPVLVLKLPPTKGASWVLDSNVQNFGITGKLSCGEEKLTVGKEAYDTISVKSSDLVMGGQSVSMETWYAKDVGMVKQHLKLPAADYDVVLELAKFNPGK